MAPRDLHRMAFVQALMDSSFMQEDKCKMLFARIVGRPLDVAMEAQYSQTLKDLNDQMGFAKFKIKTVKNPVDNKKYVGFVNTNVDEPSKLGSRYSLAQRDLFKQAMECISQSSCTDGSNGAPCASQIELLNLGSRSANWQTTIANSSQAGPSTQAAAASNKPLSKVQIEETLRQLISDGWLAGAPSKPGYLCLGVRTFLELNAYLMALQLPEETRAAWEVVL
mmetsp:Transcript_7413/g.19785  ORF Transcript_7413/g.19785 Transcript_7413/m.19785 type:complete len:223 (-) Transcript_7413:468-1136(-)